MRILHLITQPEWGGAQRYVFDVLSALRPDNEVALAHGDAEKPAPLAEKILAQNIPVFALKHLRRDLHPWHDLLAFFEIRRLLKKNPVNILHLHSSKAGVIGSMAVRLLPKNLRPRVFYTVHGFVFLEPLSKLRRAFYRWAEKITARFKDVIIVLSEREKIIAEEMCGGLTTQVVKIPLGIKAPEFLSREQARAELLKKITCETKVPLENRLWIGVIAHFYATKGHTVLLDALPEIEKVQPYVVLLVGDGERRAIITHEIRRRNAEEQVCLTGEIPDAAKYLRAFDIICLPSRKEGLPYVLLEALAANVPIVATDVGGISETLKETSQKIVPPENPTALRAALTETLNQIRAGEEKSATILHTKILPLSAMIAAIKKLYEI